MFKRDSQRVRVAAIRRSVHDSPSTPASANAIASAMHCGGSKLCPLRRTSQVDELNLLPKGAHAGQEQYQCENASHPHECIVKRNSLGDNEREIAFT
jgi:hypothetical protein